MLGKLKGLFARRQDQITEEYTTMSPQERHDADMLGTRGPEGERELIVEHEADRRFDDAAGRPREH
jgi:hypothetical protein